MLHIVHILEATIGGTRRHLRELVLGLDPAAFRVDVIVATRRDPDFARDLALFHARGIGVHVVEMQRRLAPFGDLLALIRLTRLLSRLQPDIVHAHSSKAGFLGRLAAHLAHVPTSIYTPHAFAFEITGAPLRRVLYRLLERIARHWTTYLVAVSNAERTAALSLGYAPKQIALIPNGIATKNEEPRTKSNLPGVPMIGFIGRLCLQKGPDILLAAVPAILERVPQASIRLVGDGPWHRRLMRLTAVAPWGTQVSFAGACDETGVARERTKFDLMVMPSRWEGLSYALLDALQAGLPVVAADVGGVGDVAGDDGVLLIPPERPDLLAAAVIRLLQTPAECARLSAAGPQRAQAFRLEQMIQQTAVLYRQARSSGS